MLLGAALLLALAVIAGAAWGAVRVPPADVWAAFSAWLTGEEPAGRARIFWNLRLPRVLLAAVVGMNLAVAGALLQTLTRNPLAEPHLLGVSAGGGLAAVIAIKLDPALDFTRLPLLTSLGCLVGAALVYGLAWKGGVSPLRLVLSGVAVGALLTALTTGVLLTSSITIQTAMSWLAGGLNARSWQHLEAMLPYSVVGLGGALLLARKLDVLALGDEPAIGLGLRVHRLRALLVALVAVLTGAAVAVAGLIGFAGLLVPHAARRLAGSRHAYLLPVSALLGGALLVGADAIARTIIEPRELPIGIVTAVAGAPFLLWLLRQAV